jgi:hypothetical protein
MIVAVEAIVLLVEGDTTVIGAMIRRLEMATLRV